jgi:ribosomal protein L37E
MSLLRRLLPGLWIRCTRCGKFYWKIFMVRMRDPFSGTVYFSCRRCKKDVYSCEYGVVMAGMGAEADDEEPNFDS